MKGNQLVKNLMILSNPSVKKESYVKYSISENS